MGDPRDRPECSRYGPACPAQPADMGQSCACGHPADVHWYYHPHACLRCRCQLFTLG